MSRWKPIYRTYDLPIAHYRLKERAEDKIAACVLIAPELAPSAAILPRASLTPELRTLLALAPMYRNRPAELCLEIEHQIGWGWVYKLLTDPDYRVADLARYCETLQACWSYEQEVAATLQALLALEDRAGKIAPRS